MKRHWSSAATWMLAAGFAFGAPLLVWAQPERPEPQERPRAVERTPPPAPAPPPPPPPAASPAPPPDRHVAVPRVGGEGSGSRSRPIARYPDDSARSRGGASASAVGEDQSRRPSGGARPTGSAVPRGSAPADARGGSPRVTSGSTADAGSSGTARRHPADGYYTGVAVPRGSRPPSAIPGWGWGSGYYHSSSWYYVPWGWGLGYWMYYDPWWGAYGWGYPGYGYGSYGGYAYTDETGSLRLKVKPREAQVFVDGYYVGIVDEFDGNFQRLKLEQGPHTISIRQEGFAPLEFNVYVVLDRTVTLRGELQRVP